MKKMQVASMFNHFVGFDAAWSELLMEKGCHGMEVKLEGYFWIVPGMLLVILLFYLIYI